MGALSSSANVPAEQLRSVISDRAAAAGSFDPPARGVVLGTPLPRGPEYRGTGCQDFLERFLGAVS
jgi:hypothetical protein